MTQEPELSPLHLTVPQIEDYVQRLKNALLKATGDKREMYKNELDNVCRQLDVIKAEAK